jgi:hypothetical protein
MKIHTTSTAKHTDILHFAFLALPEGCSLAEPRERTKGTFQLDAVPDLHFVEQPADGFDKTLCTR